MPYRCTECGAYLDTPWESHECDPKPKRTPPVRVHDSTPARQVEHERECVKHARAIDEWMWR